MKVFNRVTLKRKKSFYQMKNGWNIVSFKAGKDCFHSFNAGRECFHFVYCHLFLYFLVLCFSKKLNNRMCSLFLVRYTFCCCCYCCQSLPGHVISQSVSQPVTRVTSCKPFRLILAWWSCLLSFLTTYTLLLSSIA